MACGLPWNLILSMEGKGNLGKGEVKKGGLTQTDDEYGSGRLEIKELISRGNSENHGSYLK